MPERFRFGASARADRGARSAAVRRRSGPPDEERWWDPADQALAEEPVVDRRTLGRGWRPVPMVNNSERLEPFGSDPASAAVEAARSARRPTGLDEGRAFRHRNAASLVVVRSEVFADEGPGVADRHRAAWRDHAEAALDATWRERWRERDREPAWIEARWVLPGVGGDGGEGDEVHAPSGPSVARDEAGPLTPACDWLRVEDHTTAIATPGRAPSPVTVYDHLTVWSGRRLVTVVFRHDLGVDLDEVVRRCAAAVEARIAG